VISKAFQLATIRSMKAGSVKRSVLAIGLVTASGLIPVLGCPMAKNVATYTYSDYVGGPIVLALRRSVVDLTESGS